MRFTQINKAVIQKQELDEVRMSPTAFADAVKQGDTQGVLVGFEFEICAPKSTVQGNFGGNTNTDANPRDPREQMQHDFEQFEIFDYRSFKDVTISEFDQTLKLKKPLGGYTSMAEALAAYSAKTLTQAKESFSQLPEDLRIKYKKTAIDRAKYKQAEYPYPDKKIGTQLWFAKSLGDLIFSRELDYRTPRKRDSRARHQLYDTVIKLTNLSVPSDWDTFFDKIIPPELRGSMLSSLFIARHLNEYFDYDLEQVEKVFDLEQARDDYREYDDEWNEDDSIYMDLSLVLQPVVEKTMGRRVTVFGDYHENPKNMTDWYIEPDGSIIPDGDDYDGCAEIVSPPLPALEAMTVLTKFYSMAKQLRLYTNSSTGLHINVSIPQELDVLKLAVFLGEERVLEYFKREDNIFVQSILKHLKSSGPRQAFVQSRPGEPAKPTVLKLPLLQHMAQEFSRQHKASISYNGTYVSFRHAGGDYLNDYNSIVQLVGRFVRAMIIAADPAVYRNEYITKLTQLVGGVPATNLDHSAELQQLRTQGIPIYTVTAWNNKNRTAKQIINNISSVFKQKNSKLIVAGFGPAGETGKDNMLRKADHDFLTLKRALEKANPSDFITIQVYNSDGIKNINLGATTSIGSQFFVVDKGMLPSNTAIAQQIIKQKMQQAYGTAIAAPVKVKKKK